MLLCVASVIWLLALPSGCWAVFDLFVPKDAMKEVIKTFNDEKVYYVYNGTVNNYALRFKISVPVQISKLHFCWVSRVKRDLPYSIGFTVDNKLAMAAPQLNISRRGLVPKTVSGFEVNLQCTGAATSEVLLGIHINVTTRSDDAAGGNATTSLSIYRTKLCTISSAGGNVAAPADPKPDVRSGILGAGGDRMDGANGGAADAEDGTAAAGAPGKSQPGATQLKQAGLSGRALLISLGASAASILLIAALVAVYFWRAKAAYSARKSNPSRIRGQTRSAQPQQPPLSALTLHQHQQHQLQLQQQQRQLLNPAYSWQQQQPCQFQGDQLQQQPTLQQSRSRGFQPGSVVPETGSVGSGYTSCSLPSHHQKSASPSLERRLGPESRDDIMREALIPWDRITLKCILMEGRYGRLYRAGLAPAGDADAVHSGEGGDCSGSSQDVAGLQAGQSVIEQEVLIKTVTDAANVDDIDEFTRCGVLLWGQQHVNVSPLLAATQIPGDPRPHLVFPYPAEGNLKLYLSRCRTAQSVSAYCVLSTQQLIHMAVQIAKGLAHLHRKRLVHGDVACRNCVLTSDYTVKISDAALARDLFSEDYYPLESGASSDTRPIKWMPLEALADGRISQAGDVWAFGVTLWELITRCLPPYPHTLARELRAYLVEGRRLGKPTNCPDQLFCIMASCWNVQPEARPRMSNIQTALAQFHETLNAYV